MQSLTNDSKNPLIRYRRHLPKALMSLNGKRVAVTGATGGLGTALCEDLTALGATLLVFARNKEKADGLLARLGRLSPSANVTVCLCDLEQRESVRHAAAVLADFRPDVLYINAGVYAVPRYPVHGVDNVFTVNFLAPYYLIRQLTGLFKETGCRVVAVGSVAYRYSRSDPHDVDFTKRPQAALCYGNSKRTLMGCFTRYFHDALPGQLTIVHPGISFTGITSHYPKWLFALIRYPMKWIFMKPEKAVLSLLFGACTDCRAGEWIGPRRFDVWGFPQIRRYTGITEAEADSLYEGANRLIDDWMKEEVGA